jgi:hypothetical protein
VGPIAAILGCKLPEAEPLGGNVKYFWSDGTTKSVEEGAKNTIHHFEGSRKKAE